MKNQLKIIKLIKLKFKSSKVLKKILVLIGCFTIFFLIFAKNVVDGANLYKFEINFWDIVFRVCTYPFFIIIIFLPTIIIFTGIIYEKNKYMENVYLKVGNKRTIVYGNILSTLIINFIICIAMFFILIVVALFYSEYDIYWSNGILKANIEVSILNQLYPNGFISEYTPSESILFSFMEIFIGLNIVVFIRDLLYEYLTEIKIANIIVSLFIGINYIFMSFPLLHKSLPLLEYVSLHNIMILWYHKFETLSFAEISIERSLISSLSILIIVALLRVLFARKMKVNYSD